MSSLTMKDVLLALFPDGAIWNPKIDGDFEDLIEGMGLGYDEMHDAMEALASVRNPRLTLLLSDLEKEYGILTNENIDEQTRRDQLASIVYAKPGTGAFDYLQQKLQEAGFDLVVTPNSPIVDPATLLTIVFNMSANVGNHYAGEPTAVAGFSGGDLIVNGDLFTQEIGYQMQAGGSFAFAGNSKAIAGYFLGNLRTLIEYEIPDEEDRWRFMFWVSKGATGWGHDLIDGFFEYSNLTYWPTFNNASLQKYNEKVHTGIRSLKVDSSDNLLLQEYESESHPDPNLILALKCWEAGSSDFFDTAWEEMLSDNNMEKIGVADWSVGNNATLTKETGTPFDGHQVLRVAYNGTINPYARQDVLLSTYKYRIKGRARGDGTNHPRIRIGGVTTWLGTNSTSWQEFDATIISGGNNIRLQTIAIASGYTEWDAITITRLPIWEDSDMEAAGVGDWTPVNSATLTKETSLLHDGLQCLRVAYNGVTNPGAEQTSVLPVINGEHKFTGYARSDGVAIPHLRRGSVSIWNGTNSTEWQYFEVYDDGSGLDITLRASTGVAGYCEFDDVVISPLLNSKLDAQDDDPINITTPWGRGLQMDPEAWIDGGSSYPAMESESQTISVIIKPDNVTDPQGIVTNDSQGVTDSQALYIQSDKIRFTASDGASLTEVEADISADEWAHIVATRDFDGSDTFLKIYKNGVLIDSNSFSGAPDVSTDDLAIGRYEDPQYYEGQLAGVIIDKIARDQAWITAEYERTIQLLSNGSYAEQMLDEAITESRPVKGYAWGDGDGSYPMVIIKDPVTGLWDKYWMGTDSESEQYFNFNSPNGIEGIRFVTKFNKNGTTIFDDVLLNDQTLERGQVLNERKEALKRLILKYKPLHTWAGLIVEYI